MSKEAVRYRIDGLDCEYDAPVDTSVDNYGAAKCAEDFFYKRDGWECTWPLTFTLLEEDGKDTDFILELEQHPSFYARTAK
jgi:hypothetical protein